MKNAQIFFLPNRSFLKCIQCVSFAGIAAGLFVTCFAQQTSPTKTSKTNQPDAITFEKHVRPILKAHCFQCHGEDAELSGGLDVRLARLITAGGESGPAVAAGEFEKSLLWSRISTDEMPPKGKKLSNLEKQAIADWIQQGVKTARAEPERPEEARFTEEELSYWAFQPVQPFVPPESPSPNDGGAIDAFVASKLAENGLAFSPAADRSTLIRRLTLDLHGLPPTVEQMDQFFQDSAPDATEQLVDRLLASPQYGVRWGRHWLDVAGYAESDGNIGKDQARPNAWHYRDYVIRALNTDLPYDQFLTEQLAGDELIEGTPDRNNPKHADLLAATGLLRMSPDITQTDDTLMDRNQAVADALSVVSTAVLGLTVGCAQCHDHRYDPITIEDYYRFRAVFDPVFPIHKWKKPNQRLIDMTDDATRERSAAVESQAVAVQEDINTRRRAHCQTIQDREIALAPEAVRESLRTAANAKPEELTDEQKKLLDQYPKVRSIAWIVGQLVEYDMPAHRAFEAEEKKVAEIRKTKPLNRMLMAVEESRDAVPASHVFFRGSPETPTKVVTPGELTVLVSARSDTAIQSQIETSSRTTGRRLAYARQLTDGTHPLVARVAVNRIWMHHFGRGIVATPGDFGLFGETPSHPELLDWLASEFVRHGWSMKRLHRQIVLSRTYQQTAARMPNVDSGIDPDNRYLSRMNLRRLEAESIRDSILLASGQLNSALDGPSVPVAEDGEGKAVVGTRLLRDGLFAGIESAGGQAFRRSVFLSSPRALPLNMLQTFDLPAMTPNCQRRDSSTAAPQSLWFLNDESLVASSQKMAELVWSEQKDATAQIQAAFVRTFACRATTDEVALCIEFLTTQAEVFRKDANAAWQEELGKRPEAAHVRSLASLCQMLLSSNRFLFQQ